MKEYKIQAVHVLFNEMPDLNFQFNSHLNCRIVDLTNQILTALIQIGVHKQKPEHKEQNKKNKTQAQISLPSEASTQVQNSILLHATILTPH